MKGYIKSNTIDIDSPSKSKLPEIRSKGKNTYKKYKTIDY